MGFDYMTNNKFTLSAIALSLLGSVNAIAAEKVNLRNNIQQLAITALASPGVLASAPA